MVNLYAWPLILKASGVITSIASIYSPNGIMGKWQRYASVGGDGWTKVRVQVGMPINVVNNPGIGGDMPDVQTYGSDGEAVGIKTTFPNAREIGEHFDYYIKPAGRSSLTDFGAGPYNAPEYLRLYHGGDNPVCIAYIGIQMPPDGREVHIMADMMHTCGWKTYDSAWTWKIGKNNDQEIRPKCFWLGGSKKGEFPNSVWLHIQDFDGEQSAKMYDERPQRLCASEPRLHGFSGSQHEHVRLVFDPPMTYADGPDGTIKATGKNATQHDPETVHNEVNWRWVGKGRDPKVTLSEPLFQQTRNWQWPKKRDLEPDTVSYERWADQWSLSSSTEERYSAVHKCQSDNTYGPDWANSHERKYCVMETREVLQFCDADEQQPCFDLETATIRSLPSPHMALVGGLNGTKAVFMKQKKVLHDFDGKDTIKIT